MWLEIIYHNPGNSYFTDVHVATNFKELCCLEGQLHETVTSNVCVCPKPTKYMYALFPVSIS